MTQSTKIIDVTRSFVPIDPNTFPENLHATQREDSPDEQAPVIPYMGYNFLPTAHGYKSFFGTNFKASIDSLSPNEAEAIFIFQALNYENTIIALCDTGIWSKDGDSSGAWTQEVVLTPPADGIYYEWFYTIIKNKLYAFRGNGTYYYRIETDIGDPNNISVTSVSLTGTSVVTLSNQLGMGRLGGRLCFWDAENAIAWSSPDDLSDFTPSPLTGSNVTTFTSIVGKISAIRPHGQHAIVYTTKNIVFLSVEPGETFVIKARPLLPAGTPYYRQSVEAYPSTTHFAYTNSAIYKIQDGQAEVIVPEVFDYFKELTNQPVYLKFIQGRYLCFEVMDPDAINGLPLFEVEELPEETLTFPAFNSLEDVNENLEDVDWCDFLPQFDEGRFTEMQEDPVLENKRPNTFARPIWTCYISEANGPVLPVTFNSIPCGASKIDGSGVFTPSPNTGDRMKLSTFTTNATNKTPKVDSDVWVDSNWTMERFIAYQSAIWKREEALVDAFIDAIENWTDDVQVSTTATSSCAPGTVGPTNCVIGTYAAAFSPHFWGFNNCSFWLTRFITEKVDFVNATSTTTSCSNGFQTIGASYYTNDFHGSGVHYGSAADACTALGAGFLPGSGLTTTADGNDITASSDVGHSNGVPQYIIRAHWDNPPFMKLLNGPVSVVNGYHFITCQYPAGTYDKTESQVSQNQGTYSDPGVWGVETAWCEITGWEMIDNETGASTVVAATSCTNYANMAYDPIYNPGDRRADPDEATPQLIDEDGVVCDMPFEENLDGVVWEDQEVTYPAIDWLFQDGSIAPRWPTMEGFFLYDMHLKKWGKHKGQYKQLLDYFPLNSESIPVIGTDNQGLLGGVLKEDGYLYLFDDSPADNLLTWGKIGYYRNGMTDLQEVTFNFSKLSTGNITVQGSLDGKAVISALDNSWGFTNARLTTGYPPYSAKWFNISISGKFEISDIKVVGLVKGRR